MWHTDGVAYESTLQTGLDAFGFTRGQKLLNEYVLFCSSQTLGNNQKWEGCPKFYSTQINVAFDAGVNPSERSTRQDRTLKQPANHNLLNPTVQDYYVGVTLTIGGMNDPLTIVNQLFNVIPVDTHSFGKQR
jgi:hypothetical protein